MADKKYPIGGYAPGFYTCTCCICKNEFQGDKRAFQCEPCATKALHPSESAGVLPADNEVSKWFEENIDKGCSASSAIYKFRLWLKELNVGAGVKGAVWVKASERLPKVYGKITWRWLDKEAAYIGYVENRGFIYDTGGASVDPLYYNEIEWLDEGVGVKCAVWVKATERLPDKGGIDNKVIVRGVLNEQGYANHFFVAYGFRNFSKEKQEMYFEYGSKSFLTNDLEWLDESPSLAPDQSGKEDAVAFMNWTLEGDCQYSCTDENQWTNINDPLDSITTSQLYDIFKQKNK